MITKEQTESSKVRDYITSKQDAIELFENIDNYHLVQALTKEDKIAVLNFAVPDEEDEGRGWLLDSWIDTDYRQVVDGWSPELSVNHVPSQPRTRLTIESVRKYLEQVERSFGKQISDHPERKAEFERLWNLCSRSVIKDEVYEDASTYVDFFLSSFTSSIYQEESYLYTSPEASICNNSIMDEKGTFVQVEGIFEDSPGFYDLDSSSDYLLDESSEDDVDVYISLNSYITNNNKSDEKGTFVQVSGRKWQLGTDFYSDESMMYQIEYWCRHVKARYDSMEDMIAEAFVQYVQMKSEGLITGEKNATYYAKSAVNKMVNKYKYDNRKKRKSVDTVPLVEPSYVNVEDDYGSFEDWYEGLTKAQKAAVNDAKYKREKNQPMGNALGKRLRRVPKPAIGTTVQRFGSTNLREDYSYMRIEQQPEAGEVKIINKPVPKKINRPTKLLEMIENGASNRDLLAVNPAPPVLHREPESAGEGKDIPQDIQKPTAANIDNLRKQWEELLLDQLDVDLSVIEDYQVKYKLQRYADCLIFSDQFEQSLKKLGIDTNNYKEIHVTLCLDSKNEEAVAV